MADIHSYLKAWFKVYHLHMMSEPVRARWEKLQGKEYDEVTFETQQLYRDFIASIGDTKSIKVTAENLKTVHEISGDPNITVDSTYNFVISDTNAQKVYFEKIDKSTKIGERIYYEDLRAGAHRGWGTKKQILNPDGSVFLDGGKLEDRPLPDISELNEIEQKRFYRIVRSTLRSIKDHPAEFTDPDNPPKVANFLGKGKAFSELTLSKDAIDSITKLADLLDGEKNPIKQGLLEEDKDSYRPIFDQDYPLASLIKDIRSGDYKTDQKIKNKISSVLQTLRKMAHPRSEVYGSVLEPESIKKIDKAFGDKQGLSDLIDKLDPENEDIDSVQFAQFKDPRVYTELLKSLYDSTKPDRKSGFYKEFESNGGGEITKPLSLVVESFNYDKIIGKYEDQKTWGQKIKGDWGDWKNDHITKLWQRNLRHNYVETGAKGVVDAICKLEISPADGLKKILEKKADIKKVIALKSPASEKGFDFLIETLEEINNSGDMKNAFAGALKNGKQCEAIAKEIIKRAAHLGKFGEARIALETLAVMRYDIFSSARGKDVSKAINGAKFFDGASFMKNESIAFVVNAAQKTFNLGMNGAFWAGVMGRNIIQNARGKISDKDTELLQKSVDKISENSKSFKNLETATIEKDLAEKRLKDFDSKNIKKVARRDLLKKEIDRQETELEKLRSELSANEELKKINAYVIEIDEFLDKKIENISIENRTYLNEWQEQNAYKLQGVKNLKELLLLYRKELVSVAKKTLSPKAEKLKEKNLAGKEDNIEKDKIEYDNLQTELKKRDQLEAELNIAQDIYGFQKKKKGERLEKNTEHAPANDPTNELENVQTLSLFWNACNGYDFGLNLNDYNFIKKHENKSQKLKFNAAVTELIKKKNALVNSLPTVTEYNGR